jgi:hypothetical protein
MYEALIYDERDKDSSQPASTLGEHETLLDALRAIASHLVNCPEQQIFITRCEVITK